MHANPNQSRSSQEQFLAELTDAAYRVALRHGVKGSFIDVELGLWKALRTVLAQDKQMPEPCRANKARSEPAEDEEARQPTVADHRWLTLRGMTCTA